MNLYLMKVAIAADELKKADPDSVISDTTLGYLVLKNSNLTEAERYHVIGLAGSSMKLSKLKPFLADLYQAGSHKAQRQDRRTSEPRHFRRRHAYHAEDDDEEVDADVWAAVAEEELYDENGEVFYEADDAELEDELSQDYEFHEALEQLGEATRTTRRRT